MTNADFTLLIIKNNYVVPNFNYGMLCYVTIITSSYVPLIGFMEKKKDDDNDDIKIMQLTSFTVVAV